MSSERPKLSEATPKVITGWDTRSGRVVYLTSSRSWSSALGDAHIFRGPDGAEALVWARSDQARATDPYFMQVDDDGAVAGRESVRERIRERGPTCHPQFGRQAGNG
jgi:hypothetical protein